MSQPTLPMQDPILDTVVEFHTKERNHFKRGEVKEVLGEGVYRVVEIATSRRGTVKGRSYIVSADKIRAAS